jgi:hypothetical protein
MTNETIQISIRATKLPNVAGAFKGTSDPFAVVTLLPNDRDSKPKILGKTEVIKNSLDPDWTKTFFVDYELGTPVSILIKVFDEVRKGENKEMGSGVFEMGAVLGSKGNSKAKQMKRGGTLFIRAQKSEGSGSLRLKLNGISLTNTEGFMKKSDPFYQFTRKDVGPRGTEWNIVHRSDKIKNSLNPKWQEETIDLSVLCGGNVDLPLRLSVLDYESNGRHVPMGDIETTVSELITSKSTSGLKLKKSGSVTGTIAVLVASISGVESIAEKMASLSVSSSEPTPAPPAPSAPIFTPVPFAPPPPSPPTFLDYINGGCEMQLCVAIDFTGSNGDPRKPGTLHYLTPGGTSMNDYEKAISAIGGILADYDSDKKFPVWGFGAKYSGQVYHLFQCGQTAEVEGVRGVLDAYHKTFQSGLVMSSPTVITEVIQTAAAFATSAQQQATQEGKQKYSTLLILTDGAVSDVRATAQCLAACGNAPLSIIIVGIGSADFSAMQFLDDAAREQPDIVQFVEFNRHRHDFNSLTAATLQELPDQLVAYFQRNGIDPLPPVKVEEEDIAVGPAEEEIDLTLDFGSGEGDIVVGGGGGGGVFVPPPKFGNY